jgi:hypothetical protein
MALAICIPTRNRCASLRNLLTSLIPHLPAELSDLCVLVSDQSGRENYSINERLVDAWSRRTGCRVLHFSAQLAANAFERDFGEQASRRLGGCSPGAYGANRNLLLLASAGLQTLWFDDDVLVNPASFEFPAPVGESHQGWSVCPLENAVRRSMYPIDIRTELTRCLGQVREGTRTIASMPGIYGRTSLASHGSLPFEGAVPPAILSDPQACSRLLHGSNFLRQAPSLLHGGMEGFVATSFALDNREIVCPFAPTGRGEDQIWSILLRKLHPRKGIVHIPWSLEHVGSATAPEVVPDLDASTFWLALTVDMFDCDPRQATHDRYLASGAFLSRLGELPTQHYLRELRLHAVSYCRAEVLRLGRQLDQFSSAPRVLDTLHALLLRWESKLAALEGCEMALVGGRDSLMEAQRRSRELGEMLQVWPELWRSQARRPLEDMRFASPGAF